MKIDIFSGFLGAGKTTLIKKLIKEAYHGEKVVLVENEFGEIGVDGGFLKESGIQINELNSGCICCSLVGDFKKALHEVAEKFNPDRIVIEPSGVGKLSDVISAALSAEIEDAYINTATTVVDAAKCKMYMKNFGEFFDDQIKNAKCIVLSHSDKCTAEKLAEAVKLIKEVNPVSTIVTTPWDELTGEQIVGAMEHSKTLSGELEELEEEAKHEHEHHRHHHHDDDDEHECCCGHHHDDDDEDEHEHHHRHHHDDDEHECCRGHHHHDDDDEHECCCGHHHDDDEDDDEHEHHHHHHHHADEVFSSWGVETGKKFTEKEIETALESLESGKYGVVLRAKGIVDSADGKWIHFDYVPSEPDVRRGGSDVTGRLCVIGQNLDEHALKELFGV